MYLVSFLIKLPSICLSHATNIVKPEHNSCSPVHFVRLVFSQCVYSKNSYHHYSWPIVLELQW